MLGKLIKYDSRAMFRNMFPLYVALTVLTLVFSVMVRFNLDKGFLFSIFASLFIAALNGSIIACVYLVVTRFSRGLLKNEGYLSFALPVSTATHILAKVINAIIWAFIEGLMLLVCLLIMGMIMGSVREVAEFFNELLQVFGVIDREVILAVLKVIVILILEMIAATCLIYAAMAVGHLFEKHQKMVMVLFLIVVCAVRSFLLSLMIEFTDGFPYDSFMFRSFDDIMLIVMPMIFAAIYAFLTWFILDRRLNLE
ncbi:MAG: hypothetical protein IKX97_08680 [Erysipelotrichaceae bacterium]|nr:hypothetical protein [Erysipelotrichaceae bacterium]